MRGVEAFQVGLLVASIWGLTSSFALSGWGGFYTKSQGPITQEIQRTFPVQNICAREILLAQTRYNIPDNILLGIGLQEAGTKVDNQLMVWPWAVNAEGEGRLFDTKGSAMNWVGKQLSTGMRSIDIGCMQINLRWHPNAFSNLAEGFDPKANVDYAARLLTNHYEQVGSWRIAAGRYHSKTLKKQQKYLQSLQRNIRVANAQIDHFRALANLKPLVIKVAQQPQKQHVTQQKDNLVKQGYWTSALSGQGGTAGRYRSLYSQEDLQPILPKFKRDSLRRSE